MQKYLSGKIKKERIKLINLRTFETDTSLKKRQSLTPPALKNSLSFVQNLIPYMVSMWSAVVPYA